MPAAPSSQNGRPKRPVVSLIEERDAPILARPHYAGGQPSPITASLAHVPELLEVTLPFVGTVLGPSSIDARTKEIVIVRTSAQLECRYCVEAHTAVALDSGLSRAELRALRREAAVEDAFKSERERLLIAWVDVLAEGRGPVDARLSRRVAAVLEEYEVVELTLLAGATMMLNRYCTALGLPTSAATQERLVAEGFA